VSLRKKPIFSNYHACSTPLVCFKAYKISKYIGDQLKLEKQKSLNRLYGASIWQKRTGQAVLAWF
jgi:hypothetical protein